MPLPIQQYIKDLSKTDLDDVCSCWQWCLSGQKSVVVISKVGDMFLLGNDGKINWLDTGIGKIYRIADSIQQFEQLLKNETNIDKWFLPNLLEKLIGYGKTLKENEVYSFKVIPALGGDYSVDNLEPTDISVHFALTGQIHEQIKDMPEGTKINTIKFNKK